MSSLSESVDRIADETRFSGVVRVDRGGRLEFAKAYGFASRAHAIANTVETQFGLASGAKGFTALTIMSLVEEGALELTTTARSVLGSDLPLIGDGVTIEHLLAHRSGIGDYLDEEVFTDVADYVLPVPVHALVDTEQYVPVLDGYATVFEPGERFAYNNGAFVVLALIAERTSGTPFVELVDARVCRPAGLRDTAFLRSDELGGRAAVGYLEKDGLRTNMLHLPVRGTGDGGIYSTVADIHTLWAALFDGRIVAHDTVAEMVRPRSDVPEESKRYGLGFWLQPAGDGVVFVGFDAGVSFQSMHDPTQHTAYTVISNISMDVSPITRHLEEVLAP